MYELSEVRNRARIEVVHYGEISTFHNVAREGFNLSFRSIGVGPEPVFNVNAPVHNVRVDESSRKYLARSGPNRSVWRSKVSSFKC